MIDTIHLARHVFQRAIRMARTARALCLPWLLLATRVWLSQVVFVHRIMAMMLARGGHAAPPALDAVLHGMLPLLLAMGLLTRPVALVFLAEMAWGALGGLDAGAIGPKAVLLVWLAIMGPGALSLDSLLARGLSSVPFAPVRGLHQLYGLVQRRLGPVLLLAIRVGLAVAIVSPDIGGVRNAMLAGTSTSLAGPAWWTVALALALGGATRFAALFAAAMGPLFFMAVSMDDAVAILLLLLLLAAEGAGFLSVDQLVACWARGKRDEDAAKWDGLPHVVVVGGGFGGVATVRALRRAPCRITLIDQRNHHLFQPLLYQVATAALSPAEIAIPIRSLFRGQRNVRVRLGEVTGVDPAAREVILGSSRLGFDHLVLATGARHSYFGKDDWAPFAPGLKSIEDATAIRSRLLRAFEEAENATNEIDRAAWLTFVIVGGGPTGIELAGAIAELARYGLEQEYRSIEPAAARVVLVQAGPRILPSFAPTLSAAAERSLRALGVDVRLGASVQSVDAEGVDIGNQRIAARTVLWAAGVAASPAARWLGRTGDRSGRLPVADDLSVPDLPGIYAIGDTAASFGWRGEPVPGLAPAAKQQGKYVAEVIGAALRGWRAPPPFRYRHYGSLATIGRQSAVAELGKLRVWGSPAWWFWGAAHVAFLVGGRNRATVVLDWVWAYLTYRRSIRLITRSA
jgi:NADH dehydrogenase